MKKIRLRAIEPEDLDLLYRVENDRELWGIGLSNVPYSRYALHDYVANAMNDIYTDGQVRLMVETEDGEVIGIVDIVNFDAKNCRAEVGLVIERKYRCQGYASQVLRLLDEYAVTGLHLHQLYAFVPSDNNPSISLFGKQGYSTSTELPDWLYDGRVYHPALLMQKILT